jgi:hypothetical protein
MNNSVNFENQNFFLLNSIARNYSANGQDDDPFDFEIILDETMRNVRSVKLCECTFNNNICIFAGLTLKWYEISSSRPEFSFTFPDGVFYTPQTWCAYVQTQMNAITTNGYVYAVSFNSTTNQITWTTTSGNFAFDFSNPNVDSTPNDNVGFNIAYYIGAKPYVNPNRTSFLTPFASTITLGPIDFHLPYVTLNIRPIPTTSKGPAYPLSKTQIYMPLLGNYGDTIYFQNNNAYDWLYYFGNRGTNIQNFQVQVLHPFTGAVLPANESGIYIWMSWSSWDDQPLRSIQ